MGQVGQTGKCEYCQSLFLATDRRCHHCGAPLPLPARPSQPQPGCVPPPSESEAALWKRLSIHSMTWNDAWGKALVTWRI
jgi:predicted amidophosphoribosyltransferase